jgi:hypothetical protein
MSCEVEMLNEMLIKERDELKDEIKSLKLDIDKKNKAFGEFFSKFCIMKIPFGLPNDTKIIEVLITKELYENEIVPYNKTLELLLNAKKLDKPPETTQSEQENNNLSN